MKSKTGKSAELYHLMVKMGYPEEFSNLIAESLNTEWTAGRMIGYLSYNGMLPLEDVADEMLAILSDRDRLVEKYQAEEANAKWNIYLNEGFGTEEE